MKFIRRESTLHIRKRVPRRYAAVEEREYVSLSLHTDSEAVAARKAPLVWDHMIEAWEAKLAGAQTDANAQLAAAKNLAAARGYRYLQAAEVARLPLEEILNRVEAVVTPRGKIDVQEAAALLGGAPTPKLTVSGALDDFWKISKDRTAGKSPPQIRRWENPRKKAIAAFVKHASDLDIAKITTADLMKFRGYLADKIVAGEISEASANKDLMFLLATIKDVARANDIPLLFNSARLMFKAGKANTRPPFSRGWITDTLLAPGALDGLNSEARCIMLGMINTGYRPSEGSGLTAAQIRLDSNVPHIKIEAVGRKLKTDHSERIIPLVGVSLEAFRQFPNGFPKYADKSSLSDTINKYMRENKLLETDKHSLYCLRHSFEDRMLAAGVDERIRMDLMGHQIKRERYGAGADLDHLQRVVQQIAL
ncbi:MAG: tyrosine-type recombinase/integrase [Cypionkella sp.]|uniref:tyrosine-type recombinase/integrase n=1 Tax=Cypionkella sp. TaxID=2811411 RepID=UPI00272F102E|nr:tyrosine-type recombinase/integrase [Cypionkella sp.]MDP2047613.1 tyrosine-type recombinase/integrase [Cypionkella sp.]